jgi:hypothetical protein
MSDEREYDPEVERLWAVIEEQVKHPMDHLAVLEAAGDWIFFNPQLPWDGRHVDQAH